MNKYNTGIVAGVLGTLLLSALFLSSPNINLAALQMPELGMAFAAGPTNEVKLEATTLPNGQNAYRMMSHTVNGQDVTSRYSNIATIPGPTIVIKEGEALHISVTNHISSGVNANVQVDKFSFGSAKTGTYVYKAKDDPMVGLFGAIVVNSNSGKVEPYVNGGNGAITDAHLGDLSKEFVLFMVGSTFWGMEIDTSGHQTPLWTNPTISAVQGDLVRFHVLSIGPGHTFHLHAHRWVDQGTSAIIDTKLMEPGQDTHVFTAAAGDEVGAGQWQYHCHVFAHMEAGMHGIFNVVESGPAVSVAGASPYGVHPIYDSGATDDPGLVTFEITDEPGHWFKSTNPLTPTEQSLVLARPGDSVQFIMSQTNTVHTITSLLWPTGAEHFPMDEVDSYKGGGIVMMDKPGLYVFTCKVHPYMFGGVIVDDPDTQIDPTPSGPGIAALLGTKVSSGGQPLLDLGDTVTLVTGLDIPTGSDLALRLVATFFKATDSANWKDYREDSYNPSYPAVSVLAYNLDLGGELPVINLDTLLDVYFDESGHEDISGALHDPVTPGVGEVWVDTQFEHTGDKTKPGTATAIDTSDWSVVKKVALPDVNMNNPHNMWTDRDQQIIYQTEWFDNKLTTFDRVTGELKSQIVVGESPSHVMTRANNDDIHVALNGEEGIVEIKATTSPQEIERIIPMQGQGQDPTHPHAHWMSADGMKMVTPNSFTADSTLYGFDTGQIDNKVPAGALPIATGMMPDASKYYVANLLSSTLTCISMTSTPACDDDGTPVQTKTINLLEDYNPLDNAVTGTPIADGAFPLDSVGTDGVTAVGALPIQTPVSPDGRYVVTANTLSGTVTILDTSTDKLVKMLNCDPGCHGAQFGAKEGGGYYAYLSSKFSNAVLVIDMDTLTEAGRVLLLADSGTQRDDTIVDDDYIGMGGQGILPIPNVYNGWIQQTVNDYSNLSPEVQGWVCDLQPEQRDPDGSGTSDPC